MANFFKEEFIFILVALFILGITIFVTTRPFVAKGARKAIPVVAVLLAIALVAHYYFRQNLMQEVRQGFSEGKTILCMDKTNKIGYVVIHQGEWQLRGDEFVHPEFPRSYNIRNCIVEE